MLSRRRPASLRAVTMVRSRRGWRWTSDAHSAPAKPAAPSTATRVSGRDSPLLTTELPADLGLELRLDRLTPRGDVLVGQRAVVGPELEPQRERLAVLAHLLAAVDVEHPHVAQERPAALADDPLDLGREDILGDDDRDVLEQRREAHQVLGQRRSRVELDQ